MASTTKARLISCLLLSTALVVIAASVYLGIHSNNYQSSSSREQDTSLWSSVVDYLSKLVEFPAMSSKSNNGKADPNSPEALTSELRHNPIDPNTFARPDQAKVIHNDLALVVDFEKHILSGYAVLTVERVAKNATKLLLDTFELTISNVQLYQDSTHKNKLPYRLHNPVPEFGAKLEVDITGLKEDKFKVQIDYRTAPSSRALQWLNPEQTDGGKHPFMFSQCQAINARAMLPCQDTPAVKSSYTAEVKAPDFATVLMSAKIIKPPSKSTTSANYQVHHFTQKVPIPSYLIAIVAGDLVSKQLGPRSHVWSEKGLIARSAYEFEQVEQILQTAEQIAGPYVYDVYDLLILPPSFPFGGMENPCLTFVTPTLLAGDRSLVNVIAHEIAHSWTGNLVTNSNFEHFWLNEGFTTFLERKIVGRTSGLGEQARQFAALEGLKELRATIESMGVKNPITQLITDLRGINPDDAFSVVPYEKGHTFLFYLEQQLGGPAMFEDFLRAYINNFKNQSIKTEQFKAFLIDYYKKHGTPEHQKFLADMNWDGWLKTPGYPLIIPAYDTTLANVSVQLAKRWLEAPEEAFKSGPPSGFSADDFKRLSSGQKKVFLIELDERTEGKPMSAQRLERLTDLYKLRKEFNAEVQCKWLVLGLKAHWPGVTKEAVKFVVEIGRLKFLRPIYRALFAWSETKQLALDTFKANKDRMMALSVSAVSTDLGLK